MGGQETGFWRKTLMLWSHLLLLLKRLRAAAEGERERGAKLVLPLVHHPEALAGRGRSPGQGPQQQAPLPKGDLEGGNPEQQ
jgi:hypothetical protein